MVVGSQELISECEFKTVSVGDSVSGSDTVGDAGVLDDSQNVEASEDTWKRYQRKGGGWRSVNESMVELR